MQTTLRGLGAASAWFAILAQFYLTTTASGLIPGTIYYFSFFTILTNIAVAAAFTAPLLGRPAFLLRPGIRTAIAVYIFVVAAIFFFLLRKIYHPSGLGWFVNVLLHYIDPPLYLLDWALFVPKQRLTYKAIPLWLIYPLLFAIWTLIHGAISGWYPYPFLDAATFGYRQTAINISGLTLLFIVLSAAFITAGRLQAAGASAPAGQ